MWAAGTSASTRRPVGPTTVANTTNTTAPAPSTTTHQQRVDNYGGVSDAVATARRLVKTYTDNGDAAADADSGEEEEESEDEGPRPHDDGTNYEGQHDAPMPAPAAAPRSRHPARMLRANPTRATRGDAHVGWALMTKSKSDAVGDKMLIHQARREPDWPDFHEAMKQEAQALWDNNTWVMVPLPAGKAVTPTQSICERKRAADGEVAKYKGRVVVRGVTQVHKIDYFETWAPVARHSTLRGLLAAVAAGGWTIGQLDIATAFLNGDVEEEIYIREPDGYERGDPALVCCLLKALYGLKQAPRAWAKKLKDALLQVSFKPTDAYPCLFSGTVNRVCCFILVYVDDLLVASKSGGAVQVMNRAVLTVFRGRDLGEPTFFLGMHIHYDKGSRVLQLGQRQNVAALLERFGMTSANPTLLPMAAGTHLSIDGEALDPEERQVYQAMVGAVQYVATCTRPDISLVAGRLGRNSAAPTVEHMTAVKKLLRYLKGTASLSLTYGGKSGLMGYCDADFAGDTDGRRSTSGLLFTRNGAAVAWISQRQATVAASTTEAEYVEGAAAAREAVWQRRLVGELGRVLGDAVPLQCDNLGAIAMMNNPVSL